MTKNGELSDAEQHQWLGTKMSLFDQVDLMFEATPKVIPGEHGYAAAELIVRQQEDLRRKVAEIGFECFSMVGLNVPDLPGVDRLNELLAPSMLGELFNTTRGGDGSGLIGGVGRLISQNAVDGFETDLQKQRLNRVEVLQLGKYILAKLLISLGTARLKHQSSLYDLQILLSDGLTLVLIRETIPPSLLRVTDDSELVARQESLRTTQRELATEIVQDRNQLEEITANLVALSAQPQEIRTEIEAYRNEAASALAAFREQIGLKETNQLWGRQARHGKYAYYGSLFVLLAIMCGVPILGWAYRMEALAYIAEIEKTIRENGDASAVFAAVSAASRLILVTAPLALAVWAIKLIVRFNLRSMLLMDDAEQRVTMLNTYLFLVDKGAATTADRGALLEAMFRRAPGHGADTIEPPNLTDIMKYGDAVKG